MVRAIIAAYYCYRAGLFYIEDRIADGAAPRNEQVDVDVCWQVCSSGPHKQEGEGIHKGRRHEDTEEVKGRRKMCYVLFIVLCWPKTIVLKLKILSVSVYTSYWSW